MKWSETDNAKKMKSDYKRRKQNKTKKAFRHEQWRRKKNGMDIKQKKNWLIIENRKIKNKKNGYLKQVKIELTKSNKTKKKTSKKKDFFVYLKTKKPEIKQHTHTHAQKKTN